MSPTLSEGRHVTTEVSTVRDRDMSVSRMELELASRKLADSMAYVRIYDKLHKYTDLLATATAALKELEHVEHECEEEMLSRRVAEEQHTGQATLMQTQQTLISAMEDNRVVTNVALLDDANPVNSSTTVHSEESADSVGHFDQCTISPLSKDAATMIYSKYLLEIQSRITGLREENRKHQERRDQRRIDYTLESAQQAEKQYRSDTESEVDKKMKLASLNLQRSTLKIADRDWASKRTHSITSAYEAAIKSRLRNDFIVWGMLLVLTSLTFTIAASGCTIRKECCECAFRTLLPALPRVVRWQPW